MRKLLIGDAGSRVLVKTLILFSEKEVPDTEDRSKIGVAMLGLDGVVDSMRLRCDQNIPQGTQVCTNIAVIKAAIPPRDHGHGHDYRRVYFEKEKREGYERVPDNIFDRVIPEIGKEVELFLGMMKRMELPQERHFMIDVVLDPEAEIQQQQRHNESDPSGHSRQTGER